MENDSNNSIKYDGKVRMEQIDVRKEFNWRAFIYWIFSLIVSLVPLYISMIKYLAVNLSLDMAFWQEEFIEGDLLWVFSTVLLFSLVDSLSRKRTPDKPRLTLLHIIAIIVFIFAEGTWIVFDSYVKQIEMVKGYNQTYLGIFFICVILIVSTPLKIDFIKGDE